MLGHKHFYLLPKEYSELLSYQVIVEEQIFYNQKVEYLALVEEYLRENAGELGANLFVWEFSNIFGQKNNEAVEILEKGILEQGIQRLATFSIDPKAR